MLCSSGIIFIKLIFHFLLFCFSSVQIDSDVIALMDDAALEKYIPSYGDRIALFHFCKSKPSLSKRKSGLFQKLRDKMKIREDNSKENFSSVGPRPTQTKKQKTTRNVEIGWIHCDGQTAKQVRAKQGGGTRKIKMATEAGLKHILQEGKSLFFPDGISPKGSESDFEFEVWDFKQNCLNDETFLSIGNMYEAARLTMLRSYISTKAKAAHQVREPPEVNITEAHGDDEVHQADDGESGVELGVHPALDISVDYEITFGPVYNEEEDQNDTLIYEDFLFPQSPASPRDLVTVTIHHGNTLHDLIAGFSDADILNKELFVKRILPDNTEEAGSGSGVLRDALSCFWHEFYERCTLGTTVKVPFIRHDFTAETWKAVARILLKGYLDCQYFPNKLALPFIEQVLFDGVYTDLKSHFLQFVSNQEREVLMQAINDISAVEWDDLVEVLDSYGCRRRITAETFPTILNEIAHKELVQKPMFVIDCWREITLKHLSLTPEALTKLFYDLQPNSKKVCHLLKFPVDLTQKQKEAASYLKRFIRELDEIKLQKFLRFCTGSDLVITDSIFVEFQEMTEFTRRPIGHTCGKILHIADSYENFPDFRSEFNSVLESNIWVMDIV
ncbi:uncharacterized protein LOC112139717 [Oryzias melastigma]|uniref:uncharacterized protein LOC112139717 n=1 Tax=Oryzias melastigma TaxID=30732 RepID=UPI000CF81743|nr:uncharacterized protein LOC112139717 [Oryzias melastigma]